MNEPIYLCVMSDDLGMHPAINDGIARAFHDGLLTDANIMAPCPAFHQGAQLARQLDLPTGFHITLTCDWDLYRWGPLTHAPSLVTPEGYLKHLVSLAWQDAKDEEVLAEVTAQVEAIEAEGLRCTHTSNHMGNDGQGRLHRILAQVGADRVGPWRREPGAFPGGFPVYEWQTTFCTSEWPLDIQERKAHLMGLIRNLEPGYHLWMVHAAIDHPSLDDLCSENFFARRWARAYRAADMALLMDNEIHNLVEARGIERIPVTRAPVRAG